MNSAADPAYVAFEGDRRIGSGSLRDVARAAREALDRQPDASILVFDGGSSALVDLDLRGSVDDVLARIPPAQVPPADEDAAIAAPRGPGRPKLGVVAREITLLPRHWDWLAQQKGGASVAIRKLVDEARRVNEERRPHPPRAGSGLSLHVRHGRQPAAFRGGDPRAVRRRPAPFRKIDRRMARGYPRPRRQIGRAGIPPRNLSRRPVDPAEASR